MQNFYQLIDTVQNNCAITDARYARNMTMCTYLLEMRQYYRWEHDIPFPQGLPKDELGNWLVARESFWDSVEQSPYAPISIGTEIRDPFDSEAINQSLIPEGYVYSAGYGRFHKPHFFIGQLLKKEVRHGFTVLVSGCEYARDLISPPAALQNRTIFLRREAVRRMIWEKFEEWRWKKQNSIQGEAFACYAFESNPDAALEAMTDNEGEAMILHELGEGVAGELLGEKWNEMLAGMASIQSEIIARAMRDHLADCLFTLPSLIEKEAWCSLHFYFSNLNGMRRALFPLIIQAYQDWVTTGKLTALLDAADKGKTHWLDGCRELLDIFEEQGAENLEKQMLNRERALGL